MENQINMGDQNIQQIGQNPVSQPIPTPEKPKFNYWMISTLILGALLLVMLGINVSGLGIPLTTSNTSFIGTVKTGAQLGEVKSYCSNGLYLVADEDKDLIVDTGTRMLLLRLPGEPGESEMLSDQKYVGKRVEVVGKYPAQEAFCEALVCNCEDYILVDRINI